MLRGHPIYLDGDIWRYADNKEPTVATWHTRPCGSCGEFPTKDGHDPCLGVLANVSNACCGHGCAAEAYVQFNDRSRLSGHAAMTFFSSAGKAKGGKVV